MRLLLLVWSCLALLAGPALAQAPSAGFQRGVALPMHSDDPDFDYGPLLRELLPLGATHVSLFVKLFQEHGRSDGPEPNPLFTPTDATILRSMRQAHELGLKVALMPIVLLANPAEDEWRGNLTPPDWDAWFAHYGERMLHYARLAAEAEAELFVIGSELSSTEQYAGRWRALIGQLRDVFPGRLTYSANWDHYEHVSFWDALDFVGLSGYYELTRDGGLPHEPTLEQLTASWKKIRHRLTNWRTLRKIEAPILFLEIGYASQDGCARFPWDYTRRTPLDLEEQRLCYEAFLAAWRGTREWAGVFWYDWWGQGGPQDDGYTPKGKPAAEVIRRFFSE